MTPEDLRARIERDPASTALLFDFDGTLAPIVPDPASAQPAAGAIATLEGLAIRFARVAVISGRPRAFLAPLLPDGVDLSALYGLEWREGGTEADHPDADEWRPVVADIALGAPTTLPLGVTVEPKGVSLTVHFRSVPSARPEVETWAADVARATGLLARPAKASVELHPPVSVDKGTSVHRLARGCETVVFVGDDLGDLPAFEAVDELRAAGIEAWKVASSGEDAPPEIVATADLVVDGPDAVVALFTDPT